MYSEQQHYCLQKLKQLADELNRVPLISEFNKLLPMINVNVLFGSYDGMLRAAGIIEKEPEPKFKHREPKILIFDIETKPMKVWAWGLFDQNIGLEQIIEDWSVLSWAAKWVGSDEVLYQDLSNQNDYTKDELIICGIWELLNEADVVITQNGISFDVPKLNGKFLKYKLGATSNYKHIDTLRIKRKLGLTSKKLAYSTEYYNEKYKKLDHAKYSGFKLLAECLKGNQEAWAEMKLYNIHDVLALEELYFNHLISFDKTINYGVYTGAKDSCPNCGGVDLVELDYSFTKTGAFQQYRCKKCGTISSSKHNELARALTKSLLK